MEPAELGAHVDAFLSEHEGLFDEPRGFWAAQFDAGLAWVDHAPGHGGLGLPASYQEIVDARLRAAGAPGNVAVNMVGITMTAPTLAAHGAPTQLDRFLRPAFTTDEIWCQLFSEPGAGSDLASLSTRAVRDGDRWLVSGQKVWTTMAHRAHWAILLARTDPTVPRHAGLSFFLVDMSDPGVEVRPLRQITGDAEYNEVFLTDVVVPDSLRVGEVGAGWKVAMTTLLNERASIAHSVSADAGGLASRAVTIWRSLSEDARSPLCGTGWPGCGWKRRSCGSTWNGRRSSAGPESRATKGRSARSAGGSWARRSPTCAWTCGAPTPCSSTTTTSPDRSSSAPSASNSSAAGDHTKAFLSAQSLTIAAGTTNVNKNVLAERVLGLPREPAGSA